MGRVAGGVQRGISNGPYSRATAVAHVAGGQSADVDLVVRNGLPGSTRTAEATVRILGVLGFGTWLVTVNSCGSPSLTVITCVAPGS